MDYATQLAKMLARLHDVPFRGAPHDLTDYNAEEIALLSTGAPPAYMSSHPLGTQLWEGHPREQARVERGESEENLEKSRRAERFRALPRYPRE